MKTFDALEIAYGAHSSDATGTWGASVDLATAHTNEEGFRFEDLTTLEGAMNIGKNEDVKVTQANLTPNLHYVEFSLSFRGDVSGGRIIFRSSSFRFDGRNR